METTQDILITRKHFGALNSTLITPEGFFLAYFDRNLSKATQKKLFETEKEILNQPKFTCFKSLLNVVDSDDIFEKYFLPDRGVNTALISFAIDKCDEMTYADLVAEFSADKSIPFIVGMILLNAYKDCFNGFIRYKRGCSINGCSHEIWTPKKATVMPPTLYKKLAEVRCNSVNGLDDGYVVRTFIDAGYNSEFAAVALGISRPTLLKRLKEVHFVGANGRHVKDPEKWLKEKGWQRDDIDETSHSEPATLELRTGQDIFDNNGQNFFQNGMEQPYRVKESILPPA